MDWKLKVFHSGVYRHAERYTQKNNVLFVNFIYSGLRYMTFNGEATLTRCPALTIRPAGVEVSFEFGVDRENWVTFVDTPDVRAGAAVDCVAIRCGDQWVDVPWCLPVEQAQASWWQRHFMEIHELMMSPTPMQVLRAELRVVHVLEKFLTPGEHPAMGPAAQYKRLIDHDPMCRQSLERLAGQCGYSADHLRILFTQRHGLSPAVYRGRRRMQLAMERLVRTDDSIKQIASALGFSQVAHFSAAFRRHFGMTPTQALGRYRE